MRALGVARSVALLLALSSTGCVTLALGGGVVVTPSDAKDPVAPAFGFSPGFAVDFPHDLQRGERDAARVVRVAVMVGGAMTGVRTAQGALNSIAGPLVLRTDVTFLGLGRDRQYLLRGTIQGAGPTWGLERDPVGALGAYDVPHASEWSLFGDGEPSLEPVPVGPWP